MKHHCHALDCRAACPPRMLMCAACWALVSPETQREVYRTVRLRGRGVDETWAPWWRAQATAIAEVARKKGRDGKEMMDGSRWSADAYLAREMNVAAELESMADALGERK